jgi:hypothetical protein
MLSQTIYLTRSLFLSTLSHPFNSQLNSGSALQLQVREWEKIRYNYPVSTNRTKVSLPSIYRNNFWNHLGKKRNVGGGGGRRSWKGTAHVGPGCMDHNRHSSFHLQQSFFSSLLCLLGLIFSFPRFSVLFPIVFTSQPLPKLSPFPSPYPLYRGGQSLQTGCVMPVLASRAHQSNRWLIRCTCHMACNTIKCSL